MKVVNSKNIHSIHYDPKTEILEVTFHHGGGTTYHYHGVTENLYKDFENAESHGKFFNQHINHKHRSVKK